MLDDLGFKFTPTGNIEEYGTGTHLDCLKRREESGNFRPRKEQAKEVRGTGEDSEDWPPALCTLCPPWTGEDTHDDTLVKAPSISLSATWLTLSPES